LVKLAGYRYLDAMPTAHKRDAERAALALSAFDLAPAERIESLTEPLLIERDRAPQVPPATFQPSLIRTRIARISRGGPLSPTSRPISG
jgi:hypothetical protein